MNSPIAHDRKHQGALSIIAMNTRKFTFYFVTNCINTLNIMHYAYVHLGRQLITALFRVIMSLLQGQLIYLDLDINYIIFSEIHLDICKNYKRSYKIVPFQYCQAKSKVSNKIPKPSLVTASSFGKTVLDFYRIKQRTSYIFFDVIIKIELQSVNFLLLFLTIIP